MDVDDAEFGPFDFSVTVSDESSTFFRIAFPIIGIVLVAICVWLAVRIVNQRERWAKWTLAAVVGVPTLYVLSFGPACWVTTARKREFRWTAQHKAQRSRMAQDVLQRLAVVGLNFSDVSDDSFNASPLSHLPCC